MRGNLWTLAVAAIGAGVLLRVVVPAATPSSPASSTAGAASVIGVLGPLAGQLLMLAAMGALLILALRV